jgi:hypothetical protein
MALFVSLVVLVAAAKKVKNVALGVGTYKTLSNLYFLFLSVGQPYLQVSRTKVALLTLRYLRSLKFLPGTNTPAYHASSSATERPNKLVSASFSSPVQCLRVNIKPTRVLSSSCPPPL